MSAVHHIVFLAAAMLAAQDPVEYHLSYSGGDRVSIEIRIPESVPPPATFIMPRAIPMGYGEQYYDRYVRDLAGRRDEGPRWKLDGSRRITYSVDIRAMEREIHSASDSSKLRDGYAGLLGYSVFGFVEGRENDAIALRITGPEGWPVLSTLAPQGGPLRAANFYELADSQIAMGPKMIVEKSPGRIPLYLALYAEREVDRARILRLASEAMERVAYYFGSVPFPHYTVHFEVLKPLSPDHRYGFSMEHLNSGTFYLSPEDIAEDGRTRYNLAHHFAHSWIPKRSYGTDYFPFRWELAPVLDSIWFAEGFGQYAAAAALFPDDAGRQQLLTNRFRNWLKQAPPFLRDMRLEELSHIGSTRYSEDFRVGRTLFSRGALMAAEMDELIRRQTNGSRSLRDALRHLIAWSAREKRAWRIEELPAIFRQATGVDTKPVLDKWLAGTPLKD
jgi:predicted metalloprotease with PDZ domain